MTGTPAAPGVSRTDGWVVICDFDGTISRLDGTDALLKAYALPGWESLEARWVAGEITAIECMQGQVALLSVSPAELTRFASVLPIDESFPEFASACACRGIPLLVASDGLNELIMPALERLGVPELPVCSGVLRPLAGNGYRLDPAPAGPCPTGSVTCKCAAARSLAGSSPGRRQRVLLIGDGRSDFCAASRVADLVFARGKLLAHCRAHDIPCLPCNSFTEATQLLHKLVEAQAPAEAPSDPRDLSKRTEELWLQN